MLLLACPAAPAQVAEGANARYRTEEGRKEIANLLSRPDRDQEQRPRELVSSLGLKPGMTVADIGTGAGYMVPYLSGAVGPSGRVLAEDIYADFLARARQKVESEHLTNVTAVQGTETDPKLPESSVDLELVLDTYHHFNYPGRMLANLRKALREDGRLVIVDYYKRPGAMAVGNAMEHIRADQPEVIREVEANGFRLADKHDHIPNSQYVLVFGKK